MTWQKKSPGGLGRGILLNPLRLQGRLKFQSRLQEGGFFLSLPGDANGVFGPARCAKFGALDVEGGAVHLHLSYCVPSDHARQGVFVPDLHASFYLAVADLKGLHIHGVGLRTTARQNHLVPSTLKAAGAVPGAVAEVSGAIAPVACNALETQLGSLGDWFFLKGLCGGGFFARNGKKTDIQHLAQFDLGNPAPLGRDGDKVAFHAARTTDGPLPVAICPSAGQGGVDGGGVDGNGHGRNSKRGLRKKTYWFLNQFSIRHVMKLVWPGLFFFLFASGWI